MKAKRLIGAVLLISVMVTLAACSNKSDLPMTLDEEGIAPYELSDSEKYILQSFGMDGTSQIISFHAPKETNSLYVNVYRLEDNEMWRNIGGGGVSLGTDRKPEDQLTGTFAMQLKENYSIDFHINASGLASYQTDEISLDTEPTVSVKGFLQKYQTIEMNKEIPVALMVYDSGTSMRSYSLQDYFEPSKFEGMDFVQVVTLEFSDR